MPANRFYCPNDQLENEEKHHMLKVMRVRNGDTVELVDGKGTLSIAKHLGDGRLEILSKHHEKESPPCILAQGLPKQSKLEFIIEKGTELGATAFWIFPADLSERKTLSANNLRRLNQLLISAMKQCGRLYLPSIEIIPPLKEWSKPELPLYFGSFNTEAKTMNLPAIFCIGPEKGFTQSEEKQLDALGGRGVRFNRNTLRTETAAIAALSILNS